MSSTIESLIGAYVALFVVMLLAWAGLPVAGQGALIAAGILAGEGELSIGWVLTAGTTGSALGGAAGYWIGFHSGRALRSERGPLRTWRHAELVRGARLVRRHAPLAVLLAPTWVAGVYHLSWRDFLPWNVIAAVIWTAVTALGAYWIGPATARTLGVLNALIVAAGVLLVALAVAYIVRRRAQGGSGTRGSDGTSGV